MNIRKAAKYLRYSLYVGVAVLLYMCFLQWGHMFSVIPDTNQSSDATAVQIPGAIQPQEIPRNHVVLRNDVLDLEIDLYGGDIVSSKLLAYAVSKVDATPVSLLEDSDTKKYIAQSGLISNVSGINTTKLNYTTTQNTRILADGEDTVSLTLTSIVNDVVFTKVYSLQRGSNAIDVAHSLQNNSMATISTRLYGQIINDGKVPEFDNGLQIKPFDGIATTTAATSYLKKKFADLAEEPLDVRVKGGWIAVLQHYFVSAWIPDPNQEYRYQSNLRKDGLYVLGFVGDSQEVLPNATLTLLSKLYTGPKLAKVLEALAPNLDLVIDFGWLWFISKYLVLFLNYIQGIIPNWGIAIIALTFCVKLVFFPLSQAGYRSMANMRKFTPEIQRLRETYGHDKQKLSQETMALYKRERINPVGGCLPILVQMPVFIALYWALVESVELRHAPFFLWVQDLSALDPYFVLPLLMGASMYVQQMLNPTPPDPLQAKIFRWMPVAFTVMFLWFPSGLVLYWLTNNVLSIIQQYIITKRIATAK